MLRFEGAVDAQHGRYAGAKMHVGRVTQARDVKNFAQPDRRQCRSHAALSMTSTRRSSSNVVSPRKTRRTPSASMGS